MVAVPAVPDDVVVTAQRLADEVLFPAAAATDAADVVPVGNLDLLAEAGLYGLAGPAAFGGSDVGPATLSAVSEALAGGCLSTAFVWGQHIGLVKALSGAPKSALAQEWLGPLCRGERRGGLALGGLLPGPPRLTARREEGGWILDGTSPWVSGWGRLDALLVAARGPDDTTVMLVGDAAEGPGVSAERQRLVAVDASATVALHYHGHRVPDARLLAVAPYDPAAYSMGHVLRHNGSLALGVAARCCRLIGPGPLDAELDACRRQLADAPEEEIPAARAAASELAVRASAALVVHAGSSSILHGQHPERLAREALFLLAFGSRPAIRAGLLERFGARA